MHDIKPCIDRGGPGITAKEVTPDESRKCAASALEKGFPELGKSYVLAIPMAEIGPVTVLAIGVAGSEGWGAYSCDPDRKCLPVKIGSRQQVGQADRRTDRPRLRRVRHALVPRRQAPARAPRGGCHRATARAATAPPRAAATAPPPAAATAPPPAPTAPPPARH